jgi:hypothetical protein
MRTIATRPWALGAMLAVLCVTIPLPARAQTPQATGTTPGDVPPALNPKCPVQQYKTPPAPDALADTMSHRKRFRLVIGAGEFTDPDSKPLNRAFVKPTAALVDARLQELGYAPLPSLKDKPEQYLAGPSANKKTIMDAIEEMERVSSTEDIGIIYYLGHGTVTLNHNDLSLAVYDRPVAPDDGIRFSDLLATLELRRTHDDITEIPHYILILETCYSGVAAIGTHIKIDTSNNVQRIVQIQGQVVPDQITILTATADGVDNRAYDLHGTQLSAFGYFFARALHEDWACVDANVPDGILTLQEIVDYLKERLKKAYDLMTIDGPMTPAILERDESSFIAYDAKRYVIPGMRNRLIPVTVASSALVRMIETPRGNQYTCPPNQECVYTISAASPGSIKVASLAAVDLDTFPAQGKPVGGDPIAGVIPPPAPPPPQAPLTGVINIQDLVRTKRQSVAGVVLQVP